MEINPATKTDLQEYPLQKYSPHCSTLKGTGMKGLRMTMVKRHRWDTECTTHDAAVQPRELL